MTITLGGTHLVIDKDLTIDGGGHAVTVSGNNASRVFLVRAATLVLQDLTVTQGNANVGGGLLISNEAGSAAATFSNVNFSGNTASDLGGGLANVGTATLTNVTFSGNTASEGGGLANITTATLTNVTFSGNTAINRGGGLDNAGRVTLTNVTFSGNTASDGGGFYAFVQAGFSSLTNTLLAGNTGGNCSGRTLLIQNLANNLDDGETCGFDTAYGSLSNTAPLLGVLGDYGGPTQTIPLLPGSPAIDGGTGATGGCPATDQRGVARPQEAACDIGAFESQGFTLAKTGDGQRTLINTAFADPLKVTITAIGAGQVDGGKVTFTPPGSGASATLGTPNPATIASGAASVTATANGAAGSYAVPASAKGAAEVSFGLTNANATTTTLTGDPVSPTAYGTGVTFTATLVPNPGGGTVAFSDGSISITGCSAVDITPATGEAACTFSGLTAGVHSVMATFSGFGLFLPSASSAYSHTVNPASQTITFTSTAPSATVGGPVYTPAATATSGLPVSFAIDPASSAICTLTGGQVSFQAAGSCTINANQAGNSNFNAAPPEQQSFSVLATQVTGDTPGGPVTARITGGCLGFQTGSTQFTVPTRPPAGANFPYGVFGFTALQCGTGGTLTLTLTYPQALQAETRYWKNISGTWVDWTNQVKIAGNTVILTITDGGAGDTNPAAGEISDPSGPAFGGGATSIPTLSEWGLILLGLALLTLAGWRQRQGFTPRGQPVGTERKGRGRRAAGGGVDSRDAVAKPTGRYSRP